MVGPLSWTPQSTLLFPDSDGTWQEANPAMAQVKPLPSAFVGARLLTLSPKGDQVLYYRGNQLWTARRDGTQPTLIGENLTGWWEADGTLGSRTATQPPPPSTVPTDPPGMGRQ